MTDESMTDGPEVVCCACGGVPLVSLAPPLCAECHPNAKHGDVMTDEPISLRDVAEALSWLEPTGLLLHRHSSQEAACEEWITRVVGVLRSLEHTIRAEERERCAQIADGHAIRIAKRDRNLPPEMCASAETCAADIAEAIRMTDEPRT